MIYELTFHSDRNAVKIPMCKMVHGGSLTDIQTPWLRPGSVPVQFLTSIGVGGPIHNKRQATGSTAQLGQSNLPEASAFPHKVADISLIDVVSVCVLTNANKNAFVVVELKTTLLTYLLSYLWALSVDVL